MNHAAIISKWWCLLKYHFSESSDQEEDSTIITILKGNECVTAVLKISDPGEIMGKGHTADLSDKAFVNHGTNVLVWKLF